ncbi:M20 metallopeptidase family protein [Corynebacterium timonense]|uniref:Carboxypeptidase Ss1. Metallo peptidase. MEROPS family M20D n=1 Tax=Corynebacterium timonense TaxID=441500 RepID=A0A1H1S2Q0_9CORY|nr:amidohydrolase [Corynebacterium timonense]SDS42046.1 carboxypeptidase Ss1. Metallo peptidase. MEROPS family M20D [Corynebacterium timonense]
MSDNQLSDLYTTIDEAAAAIASDVTEWRHHLHQNPELSNREEETERYILDRLAEFGIEEVTSGIAGHGIAAWIRGNGDSDGDSRTILLRADTDALPVKENSGEDFASEKVDKDYPGGPFPVAHACGHDTHIAMLLGASKVLQDLREELNGDILLVFQPAEEGPPAGEPGGADLMVKEMEEQGFFDPAPTMAFGIHIVPAPVGAIAYARGIQNAASETVKITIVGEQVHGSTPWQGVDPMPAVGDVLSNIGQIYRQVDVKERFSISLGHIVDQGRFNIIGNQVEIWGTVRSLTTDVMEDVNERIARYVSNLATAHGCEGTVEFFDDIPPVVNAPEWLDATLPTYERVADGKPVFEIPPSMGYDDVSEFIARFGGVYALLGGQNFTFTADGGVENTEGDSRGMVPNHSPKFYVNDDALTYGVRLHAQVAVDHLMGELNAEAKGTEEEATES